MKNPDLINELANRINQPQVVVECWIDQLELEAYERGLKDAEAEQLTKPDGSGSSPNLEEIRTPFQEALYATGNLTVEQCDTIADGILLCINEAGLKVVRQ